jgi:hypothetical protein
MLFLQVAVRSEVEGEESKQFGLLCRSEGCVTAHRRVEFDAKRSGGSIARQCYCGCGTEV